MQSSALNMRSRVAAPVATRSGLQLRTVLPVTHSRRCAPIALAVFAPATVAETKKLFLEGVNGYKRPVAQIYNGVLQELLVQMHFVRYSINYEYDAIYALGFVSVFDSVMESMAEPERKAIFSAYLGALKEDPHQYRKDAEELESLARQLSGPEGLVADASGTTLQKALAKVSERSAAGKFQYSKFFAIGLFRLLELTGAKEPSALERLVKSLGVRLEAVNRDLLLYKGILSKLSAAKELMKEFLEREKRKQQEREADKAARAAKAAAENNGAVTPATV